MRDRLISEGLNTWGVGCGAGGTKDDLNGLGQTDRMEKEATSQLSPRPVSASGFWLPGRQEATEKEHSLEARSPRELIHALVPSVAPHLVRHPDRML